jgi:hypothetical protein
MGSRRAHSLFCLMAALTCTFAINTNERHGRSHVLEAAGEKVVSVAHANAEPISVSIAAAVSVAVTVVKTTKAILKALVSSIQADSAARIEGIVHEASASVQDILNLFSDVSGDVDLRLKDTVQEVGLWILEHLPWAEVDRASRDIIKSA